MGKAQAELAAAQKEYRMRKSVREFLEEAETILNETQCRFGDAWENSWDDIEKPWCEEGEEFSPLQKITELLMEGVMGNALNIAEIELVEAKVLESCALEKVESLKIPAEREELAMATGEPATRAGGNRL